MRKNKKLEQIANQSIEHLKNDEFLNDITENVPKIENKNRKSFVFRKIIVAACVALVVLIAIPIGIFFGIQENDGPQPPEETKYLGEYEKSAAASLEELNREMQGANISIANPSSVIRKYDGLSNDDLYYVINWANDDTFETLTIIVITNPKYEYIFDDPQSLIPLDKSASINGLNMKYREYVDVEEDIYFYDSAGYIECTERIHITYTGISVGDNISNFLTLTKSMITKK